MNCSKGERYAHKNNRLKSYGDHNRGDCALEISNLEKSDFGVWKCRVQRVRQECADSLLVHLCLLGAVNFGYFDTPGRADIA